MKKIFITLSAVFIMACSDNTLSGYTGAIIKGADTSNTNISAITKEVLKKTTQDFTEDEDFSSLDNESLKEKLLNTYPTPKAEPKPKPEYRGPADIYHPPYTDDEIKDYIWDNNNPSFLESPKHKYGFDRDPLNKEPDVYISVETGSDSKTNGWAYFIPYFNNDEFDKFMLIPQKYHGDISKGIELTSGKTEKINEEGIYELWGCSLFCNISAISLWKPTNKEIILKAYPPKTKHIIYVQLDGDGWEADDIKCDNGFSKNCVTKIFNDEIYNQAVVKAQLIDVFEEEKKFPLEKNFLMEVDMNDPSDEIRDFLEDIAYDYVKDMDPKYWHVVYAINKQRKEWHLSGCSMVDGDLAKCNRFLPHLEPSNTKYFMKPSYEEKCCKKNCGNINTRESKGIIKKDHTPVTIKQYADKEKKIHYYIFDEKGEKIINYNDCDILYTDNGYPVLPSIDGINDYTAAASLHSKYPRIQEYLPKGSTIIAPRKAGKSGLYVLMHELGHSFGLTDVDHRHLFLKKNDDSYDSYASSETNLMSWIAPNGKKLRYRGSTPIACTGGKPFYITGNDEPIGILENIFEPEKDTQITGEWLNGEKQWDCIRDCQSSLDFLNNPRYSAFNYHLNESECHELYDESEDYTDFENSCIEKAQKEIDKVIGISNISEILEKYRKNNGKEMPSKDRLNYEKGIEKQKMDIFTKYCQKIINNHAGI